MKTRSAVIAALFVLTGIGAAYAGGDEKKDEQATEWQATPTSAAEWLGKAAQGNVTEVLIGKLAYEKAQNEQVKQYARTLAQDHAVAATRLSQIAQKENLTLNQDIATAIDGVKTLAQQTAGVTVPADQQVGAVEGDITGERTFERESSEAGTPPKTGMPPEAGTSPKTGMSPEMGKTGHMGQSAKIGHEAGFAASVQVDQIAARLDATHKQTIDKVKGLSSEGFDKQFLQMSIDDHEKDIKEYEEAATNLTNTELQQHVTATLPVLKLHLQTAQNLMRDVESPPAFERRTQEETGAPKIHEDEGQKMHEPERSPAVPSEQEEPLDY